MRTIIVTVTLRDHYTSTGRSIGSTPLWLSSLAALAAFNAGVWSGRAFRRAGLTIRRSSVAVVRRVHQRMQLPLTVCPRVNLERVCLWDTWLSTIRLGRTVATRSPELCFALQCALFVQRLSEIARHAVARTGSTHLFSGGHPRRTGLLVHGAVDSTASATLIEIALGAADAASGGGVQSGGIRRARVASRHVDRGLPVLRRWRRSDAGVRPEDVRATWRTHAGGYLTLATGLRDNRQRRHPTLTWDVWRVEAPWMTVYFSIGVWTILAMVLFERAASRS